jgi:hypothetical protein
MQSESDAYGAINPWRETKISTPRVVVAKNHPLLDRAGWQIVQKQTARAHQPLLQCWRSAA